jgi:polyisoprenoid-binding protein YceI
MGGVCKRVFHKAMWVLCVAAVPSMVLATPIDTKRSSVSATFKQFNVPVTGEFKQFSGDVQYDPAKPANTQARLTVNTASYDLGDAMYNKEVAGPEWFHAQKHPTATFVMTGVGGSGNALQAKGDLTIRGITKPVQFPVRIQTGNGLHTFTGKTQIKRLEYKVGADGDWGDEALVADAVEIEFKMVIPAK